MSHYLWHKENNHFIPAYIVHKSPQKARFQEFPKFDKFVTIPSINCILFFLLLWMCLFLVNGSKMTLLFTLVKSSIIWKVLGRKFFFVFVFVFPTKMKSNKLENESLRDLSNFILLCLRMVWKLKIKNGGEQRATRSFNGSY